MIFTCTSKKKIIIAVAIILAVIISVICICCTGVKNVFGGKERQIPIYSVDREDKKIAISFDCAWGVDYTDTLLKVMQEEGIKCTFFAVEFWTKKHPDYIKKISDSGHEIGTHSATHPYMSKLSKSAIEKELSTSKKAIEDITGKTVEVFRPPYGDYNNLLIETAREVGLYTVQWSVDSLDWKDLSANEIYKRVVEKTQSGSIILCHNQGLHTAEALPKIIKQLKAEGYQFVSIGELIYRENYHVDSNGKQIKNS